MPMIAPIVRQAIADVERHSFDHMHWGKILIRKSLLSQQSRKGMLADLWTF
jgi:hypothetical protein